MTITATTEPLGEPMTFTRVYLAGRFETHPLMRERRAALAGLGRYYVTSRWIDLHGADELEAATGDQLAENPAACARYALNDVDDLRAADVVISFTEGGGGRGGRHVEFGLALALEKRLLLVGPREHVFHALPQVQHYATWPECLAALAAEA